jgi:hypothetical protein
VVGEDTHFSGLGGDVDLDTVGRRSSVRIQVMFRIVGPR